MPDPRMIEYLVTNYLRRLAVDGSMVTPRDLSRGLEHYLTQHFEQAVRVSDLYLEHNVRDGTRAEIRIRFEARSYYARSYDDLGAPRVYPEHDHECTIIVPIQVELYRALFWTQHASVLNGVQVSRKCPCGGAVVGFIFADLCPACNRLRDAVDLLVRILKVTANACALGIAAGLSMHSPYVVPTREVIHVHTVCGAHGLSARSVKCLGCERDTATIGHLISLMCQVTRALWEGLSDGAKRGYLLETDCSESESESDLDPVLYPGMAERYAALELDGEPHPARTRPAPPPPRPPRPQASTRASTVEREQLLELD